ncbi:MAG: YbaK/EbsC family protein [Candidatus Omnitrophota bacterium]
MAVSKKITAYLTKNKVKCKSIKHKEAFTAQEIAASADVPGKQVIKSVLVKTDDNYVLAVLPAIHLIDFTALKKLTKAKSLKLASEKEIEKVFPDFEVGAMPPFGNIYDVPVYADDALKEDLEIVFNAGTHTDLLKIKYKDFEKLAKPKLAKFGKHV